MFFINFYNFEFITFFIIFVRYSVFFVTVPFFGDHFIPASVKIFFSFFVSFFLYFPLLNTGIIDVKEAAIWGGTIDSFLKTIILEVIFGFLLGYSTRLVFDGIFVGASYIGNFMGFSLASTFDPHQEVQSEVIAQFNVVLAMLLFLLVNGHHTLLSASFKSYHIIGIGKIEFGPDFINKIIKMSGDVLSIGFKIASPIALSVFLINISLAIISRAVPQLNLFSLAFSITILASFWVIWLSYPFFENTIYVIFSELSEKLFNIMSSLRLNKHSGR